MSSDKMSIKYNKLNDFKLTIRRGRLYPISWIIGIGRLRVTFFHTAL